MERPVKRQRIALDPPGTDDEDELDCEPNELNQRRDPVYQLEQARARASNKLKSRFEDIFARYEKDFTGIGDEIDLRTGEVVVNNGHLQSITGAQEFGEGDDYEDEDTHLSVNDRSVHGTGDEALGDRSSDAAVQEDKWKVTGLNSDPPQPAGGVGGLPRLSFMMPPAHESAMPPDQPFGSSEYGNTQVSDPVWQAPELPRSAFMSPRFGAQAQKHIFGIGPTTKVTRRSLLELGSQDGEEEDVLLGVPDKVLGKESPLIKSKFPPVESSPNNDPALHEMIQDVIKTIANTSPSAEQSRKGTSGTKSPAKPWTEPVRADADVNCKPGKKQTSENWRGSTGKAKAVSSSQTNAAKPCSNKRRRRQIPVAAPVKAVTIRKKKEPKTQSEQYTTHSTVEQDPSGEYFVGASGNMPAKPAGQTFYVEIKARKIVHADSSARDQHVDGSDTVGKGSAYADVSKQTLQPLLYGPRDAEEEAVGPPNGNCDVKPTREESRSTVPQKQAQERFERNVVDPSYAFSDEDNLLPIRKKNKQRNLASASRTSLAAQDASRIGEKGMAGDFLQATAALDDSDQEKQDRAARPSPQKIVGRGGATRATEVSKSSQEQRSESTVFGHLQDGPLSPSHRQNRRNRPEKTAVEQPEQQANEESNPRLLRGCSRNKAGDGLHGPSELIHKPRPDVASIPAESGEERPPSAKPPKAAEPAAVPPSTPQPKPKPRSRKTGVSSSGLISLLSDDDDEEDEISFNLDDFTPTGHHRILALRQHHHQPATASTGKKRRVASLLFSPTSTSKTTKHGTPGSANRKRKRRHRSANVVAGSVVKVRRDSPGAPSPPGSVVQTPGGTKRKCGKDGFRCERDFCFACISI